MLTVFQVVDAPAGKCLRINELPAEGGRVTSAGISSSITIVHELA